MPQSSTTLAPDAIQAWRDRIRIDTMSRYQFLMGVALERTEGAAAILWYRRALDLMPGHPAASVRLIRLLRTGGDDAGADAIHRAAVTQNPAYVGAANAIEIETTLEGGDPLAAAEALTLPDLQTVGAEQRLSELAVTVGETMIRLGRCELAATLFQRALSLVPRNQDAELGAIHADLLLMKFQSAADKADAAVARHPDSLPLKRMRISARLNLGLPVMADVEDVLAANPQDLQMLRVQGQQILATGDAADALERFRAVLALGPTNPAELSRLHLLCGQALVALKRVDEALSEFEAGSKADGGRDSLSLALIAYANAVLGRSGAAEAALESARQLLPEQPDPWMLFALALALAGLSRLEEARACLNRAWQQPERAAPIARYFPWAGEILRRPVQ